MGQKSGALAWPEPKLLKGGVTAIKAVHTIMEVYLSILAHLNYKKNSMGQKNWSSSITRAKVTKWRCYRHYGGLYRYGSIIRLI